MVKLLRTDTTLDLSQKARVVRISDTWVQGLYSLRGPRTDHLCALIGQQLALRDQLAGSVILHLLTEHSVLNLGHISYIT